MIAVIAVRIVVVGPPARFPAGPPLVLIVVPLGIGQSHNELLRCNPLGERLLRGPLLYFLLLSTPRTHTLLVVVYSTAHLIFLFIIRTSETFSQ